MHINKLKCEDMSITIVVFKINESVKEFGFILRETKSSN